MINLALGGYEESAIRVLNLCDLSEEQKAVIERIIKKQNIKDYTPSEIKQKIIKKLDSLSVSESKDLMLSKKSTSSCSETTLISGNEHSAMIFSSFPKELVFTILANLPVKNAQMLGLTCRTMYTAARDNYLWRFLCQRDFQIIPCKDDSSLELYRRYSFNLPNGVYASKTFKGHTNDVASFLIHDGMLYSVSFDNTIKIWSLDGVCTKTCEVGDSTACSIAIDNGMLYLGCDEGEIQIWNLETMKCEKTVEGHKDRVTCLIISDGKLYSSSTDQKSPMKIWDLKTMECSHTLTGSLGGIRAFVLSGSKIITNSASQRIQVWDLSIGENRSGSFIGHTQRVLSFLIYENQLISASRDGMIKIWDLDSLQCLDFLAGHCGRVKSLVLSGKYLISGSMDSTIKIWDLKTKQCLVTLEGHEDLIIKDLKLNNGKVYASIGNDIKCFDFTAKDEIIIEEIESEIEIADNLITDLDKENIHHPKKIAEQRLSRMRKSSNDIT